MSVNAVSIDKGTPDAVSAFKGLDGVEALVASPALEILRELGHGPELVALMKLAQLVEEQEAALCAAA